MLLECLFVHTVNIHLQQICRLVPTNWSVIVEAVTASNIHFNSQNKRTCTKGENNWPCQFNNLSTNSRNGLNTFMAIILTTDKTIGKIKNCCHPQQNN